MQDLLAGDAGPQAFDRELAHACVLTPVDLHDHVVAVDPHVVDGHRPGGRQRVGLAGRRARTCCRASSTRSRARRTWTSPSDSETSGWLQRSPMAYTVVADAHQAMRWPSTSNRRASPVGELVERRTTRSVRHATALAVELGRDRGAQLGPTSAGTGRRSSTSAKKPGDDQPLGDVGGHAPALEVEALLLVDRPDGGGVAAVHVVVLDLEVRHRLGPGVVGELDVAVRLEGVGAARLLPHPDEPGVHRRERGRRPRP